MQCVSVLLNLSMFDVHHLGLWFILSLKLLSFYSIISGSWFFWLFIILIWLIHLTFLAMRNPLCLYSMSSRFSHDFWWIQSYYLLIWAWAQDYLVTKISSISFNVLCSVSYFRQQISASNFKLSFSCFLAFFSFKFISKNEWRFVFIRHPCLNIVHLLFILMFHLIFIIFLPSAILHMIASSVQRKHQ